MFTFIYLLAATGATGNDQRLQPPFRPSVRTVEPAKPKPYMPQRREPVQRAQRPNPIPKGNPGNWVRQAEDYPPNALAAGRQGTTGFELTVGPNGRALRCVVTSTSGSVDLDQATCSNLLLRARFDPALDAGGNPTTGKYRNRSRWQIPRF